MPTRLDDLIRQALELSSADRAMLADQMVSSLTALPVDVGETGFAEWEQRLEELRVDERVAIPAEQALWQVRQSLATREQDGNSFEK